MVPGFCYALLPFTIPFRGRDAVDELLHPVGGLPAHPLGDMTVNVQRETRRGMAQISLDCLNVVPTLKGGHGVGMPIGYNRDKSEIPVFARGLRFVLVLFPSIFLQKIGIARVAKK